LITLTDSDRPQCPQFFYAKQSTIFTKLCFIGVIDW